MNLNIQLKVPGYRIDKFLGKGGMATVYLATQMSLGRAVALKVLNDPETPQFFERFFNEGRCVARLQHNNLVTIYDIGQGEGFYYIAMEHLPGGDLKSRIAQGIKPGHALKILTRLASCVGYVHSQGLVHRDIKPSNVLFRADGTPVLTDFGIAKLIQADNDLTLSGTVMGSPHYLSPEQAQGNRKLDGRSDLYSLGVVLYEMLAGRKPYSADNFAATLMAHIRNPVPLLPSQFVQFQPLIDRLLAKKPEERFQSGTELANNIRLFRGVKMVSTAAEEGESDADATPSLALSGNGASKNRKGSSKNFRRNVGVGAGLLGCLLLSSLLFGWTESPQQLESNQAGITTNPGAQQPNSIPKLATSPTLEPTLALEATSDPTSAPVPTPRQPRESALAPIPAPMMTVAMEPQHDPVSAPAPVSSLAAAEQSDSAVEGGDELSLWLEKAQRRIRDDRLSFPRGESARDYVQKVLVKDPGNSKALLLQERIADRYLELARKRMNRGEHRKARRLIAKGLATHPGHTDLTRLQKTLANKPAANRSMTKKTATSQPRTPDKYQQPRRKTAPEIPLFTQEHGS